MNNYKNLSAKRWSLITWLIIITSIISVIGFIVMTYFPDKFIYLALNPINIMSGKYLWTIITHMFIHGSIAHLAINMFVLFSLGSLCEKIIGRKRFFWFYLISGIFAGLLSVFLAYYFGPTQLGERIFGSPNTSMVGVSGAIFAIAGLYVILLPKLKFMIIFLPLFSLPAYIMIPIVLFLTWIVSFLGNFPIGNAAHLGGFLVGLSYGLYLKTKYKRKVVMLQKMFR